MNHLDLKSPYFVLDDLDTWPSLLTHYLAENRERLEAYIEEEERIDKVATTDVLLRINRPSNQHTAPWHHALSYLGANAQALSIVGFHCARLTDFEVENIKTSGLQPLNPALTELRIRRLYAQALINADEENVLLSKNKSADSHRADRLFVFLCLSTLSDDSGLYRLFRSWGGEAIYSDHETSSIARDALRRIGTPCIVVTSFSSPDIRLIDSLEERMIRQWLDRQNSLLVNHDTDVMVTHPLEVLDIITQSDPRFEQFTRFSTWSMNDKR